MEQQVSSGRILPGRNSTDIVLSLIAFVLAVAVLGSTTFLAYSVWTARSLERAATPTARAIEALYGDMQANPGDVVLRVRLAEALASAGRFDDATRELEAALGIDPEHTGAHLMMGIVSLTQRQYSVAEPYLLKVIELTSGVKFQDASDRRELAFFYLGEIALNQSRFEDAAGFFKEALRIRRDSSITYVNLGLALKGMDETQGAIENFENALVFDPTYAQAHYELGQIHLSEGDRINAAIHFVLAARYAPDQEEPALALLSLGSADQWAATVTAALEERDFDRAIEAALIARVLDEENVEYIKMHAQVLEARGATDDARDVYSEALELAPDDVEAQAALIRLGD